MRLKKILLVLFFSSVVITTANAANTQNTQNNSPIISFPSTGGVEFSTTDGTTNQLLSGYIQAAYANFSGDTLDQINHTQNLYNGAMIPSARLILSGTIDSVWKDKFSYDFAVSQLADAYLKYIGFKHLELMVGQYIAAFNSEISTSREDITFISPSLPALTFTPSYVIGTQALVYTNHWTATAGAFGVNASNTINGIPVTGNDPLGVNGRPTFASMHEPRKLLFFGVSDYARQTIQSNSVEFRAIPEMLTSGATSVYLVDTGIINNSKGYNVSNAEFAATKGSFTTQAYYYLNNVNRTIGSNLIFNGYDASIDYFLTGESRVFNFKKGCFGTISNVNNSYGARELVLRYSHVDLSSQNILGGIENDTAAAINWYPIQRIKLGLDYIYADATPSSNGFNRHANIVAVMLQTML